MGKSKPEPELYVFDICDTLFYSNTTFDFIKFVLESRRMTGELNWFRHYTKKASPVFLTLAFLQKLSKADWHKKLALKLLQGISRTELYTLGEQFEQQFLPLRVIAQTHQMLNKLKADGKLVVLISASLDPVVAAIAKTLQVDFRCSELEYDARGNSTGNLKFEMTGRKLSALQEMLSHQQPNFAVATDNFSDFGLVEAACQRYVVVYNEKSLNFWKSLNPEFIKLYS